MSDTNTKVIRIGDGIVFDNGMSLIDYHGQDCCESHYLGLDELDIREFDGLEFDLSNDNFFERIDGYGIALLPINGHPVRIAGYGYNNGYYSSQLDLQLVHNGEIVKSFDISECQDISE